MVNLSLTYNANKEAKDKQGGTLLHLATLRSYTIT